MAEAAGLVLGAVALLSTFRDCIDLFSDISAAQSLGSDYELLNTKLDIEKTLLLQWAERVRLLQLDGYDERLDNPIVNRAVSGILAAVQRLLSESSGLQQRYGLKRVEMRAALAPAMSGPRMHQFLLDFERLKLQIDVTQKEASVKRRFFWVVRDKEKFNTLVQELSILVAKLNEVVPATHSAFSLDAMTRGDLRNIRHLRELQLVLDAARDNESVVADLAEEDVTVRCRERVLERLWFRKIEDRRNNVAEAHKMTLQWALQPPSHEAAWDDLSEWLRMGSDIYWVCGKAGSGKSTLMKYCYRHAETRRLLEQWAGDRRLIMADFFFWHLGAPEQKTHQGLSRGLLYCVLSTDPTLIERVLPDMWRDAHRTDKASLDLPSDSEMAEAFSTLSHASTKEKFCFFVDGLDEYAGNHLREIEFLNSLVTSGTIKVLVSSRPLPSCYQAFSSKKRLQLQDLTRDDIKAYVDDTIGSHAHTKDLKAMDSDGVEEILQDLVNKASGVFLWVVLACRSLLEGFAAFDYIDELRRRVDELPPELENLFTLMLGRIEPRYQGQAAKLLRICFQRAMHPEPDSHTIDDFGAVWGERTRPLVNRRILAGVYTLGLALVDEVDLNCIHHPPSREISVDERRMKCKVLEARLRSRCCGLLEVQHAVNLVERCFCGHLARNEEKGLLQYSLSTAIPCDPERREKPDDLIDSTIQFMHRTVFEFLTEPNVWDLDCLRIDDSNFEANATLSGMNLRLLSLSATEKDLKDHQMSELMARECLLCARYSDAAFGDATPRALLNFSHVAFEIIEMLERHGCLEKTATDMLYLFFFEIKRRVRPSKIAHLKLALLLAVELGMVNTVKYWESRVPLHLRTSGHWPLLYHALSRPLTRWLPYFGLDPSPNTVAHLLSKGSDPNQLLMDESPRQTTPWKHWLMDMRSGAVRHSSHATAEITMHLLKAGADLNPEVSEELHETVESTIRRRVLGGRAHDGHTDREFDIPSRDRKVLASRWEEILDFIALRRATNDSGLPASNLSLHGKAEQGPGTRTRRTASASGLSPEMEGCAGRSTKRSDPEPDTDHNSSLSSKAGPMVKKKKVKLLIERGLSDGAFLLCNFLDLRRDFVWR